MSDQSLDRAAQAWAAEQLGLEPDFDSDQVRRAIWTRLAETGFGSHDSRIEAADLLLRLPGAVREPGSIARFRDDYERSLGEEIAAFTTVFLDVLPAERRERWTSLASQAASFPRLRWRLDRLQSGLAVDTHQLDSDDDQANPVVGWCGELFLLGPQVRSARKLEILSQLQEMGQRTAIDAAKLGKRLTPEIVALAPDLVSEIVQRKRLARRRAAGKKSLARRQMFSDTFIVCSLLVVGAVVLGIMIDKPASRVTRSQPDGIDSLQRELKRRASMTIDADDLLSAANPYRRVVELTNRHPFQVRATAEQIQQLKQRMSPTEFGICFGRMGIGDGMSQLIDPDKVDPATLVRPAPPAPDQTKAREGSPDSQAFLQALGAAVEELENRKRAPANSDDPAPEVPDEDAPK